LIKSYYYLAKPGIIYGNLITAAAGFLLASQTNVDWYLFLALLGGTALVIGSACAFNNYIDRGVDSKMARTKKRALVSGNIHPRAALVYASVLGIAGFLCLLVFTNTLATIVELVAFIFYVIIYGWAKRNTSFSTLIGTIPGAAPPVAGYVAVTNNFDGGALILFFILVFWQLPHFYGIALYRFKDYKAAGLPVMSVSKGFLSTKIQTLVYILAFMVTVAALWYFNYAGYTYLIVVELLALAWLVKGIQGFDNQKTANWGKKIFLFSLIVNVGMSVMIGANSWLVKL